LSPSEAASKRTSASFFPYTGCGTVAQWYPGDPSLAAWVATIVWNGSVIRTVAGVPRSSISSASCRLHDEQAPQSPTPVITRCARAAIPSACATVIG
jgi:hypothetical protein